MGGGAVGLREGATRRSISTSTLSPGGKGENRFWGVEACGVYIDWFAAGVGGCGASGSGKRKRSNVSTK